MIQLLLCDDDEIILEGIEKCIDWSSYGIELTATATNGKRAREILLQRKIDFLITDIKMPFLSGLELVKEAKAVNADIITVMLSGYNDFEYARKAIKLGALDFISKPIDIEELDKVIRKAVDFYEKIQQGKNRELEDLVLGALNGNESQKLSDVEKKLMKQYQNKFYQVLKVELDEFHLVMCSGQEELKLGVIKDYKNLIHRCQNEGMVIINKTEYSTTLCLVADNAGACNILTSKLWKWIGEVNRGENGSVKITMAEGECHSRIESIRQSAEEAEEALKYKFIKGIGSLVRYRDIKCFLKEKGDNNLIYHIQFESPMKVTDREEIHKKIQSVKKSVEMGTKNCEPLMRMVMGNWFVTVSNELAEYDIDMADIFEDPMKEFEKVWKSSDFQNMMENFEKNYMEIYDYIQNRKQGKYIAVISMATHYIKDHYMKSTLSIEEVADYVSMSVGYFSLIFHNETKKTFTDYVVHVRIEKAKEMLAKSNLKLYEISHLAGYDNPTYFSTVFKKVTGFTPTGFKDSMTKESKR